jgi:hypothetical protein
MANDKLTTYKAKRDFQKTREPSVRDAVKSTNRRRFVIQKHATRLHYDLRLELDGVFKSWAVYPDAGSARLPFPFAIRAAPQLKTARRSASPRVRPRASRQEFYQ